MISTSVHWGALSPMLVLIGAAILMITFGSISSELKFKGRSGAKLQTGEEPRKGIQKEFIGPAFAVAGGLGGFLACCILWLKVDNEGAIVTIAETVRVDQMGLFISAIISAAVLLSSFAVKNYLKREKLDGGIEVYALMLLSAAGGCIMATANDLIILFMGLETLSIAVYVLAAAHVRRSKSLESGMKYFIMGAFTSAFFLYGIALIYGATGSTKLTQIAEKLNPDAVAAADAIPVDDGLLLAGLALFLVGLLFKISAVPFHAWTPDVYEGAPSPFVAFMSSAVKAAGFAALIRVLGGAFIFQADDWQPIIYAVAIASMALGALAALVQTNVKRMLAYSSISHAGFILLGVQAGTADGFAASLWYLAAYGMLALGSFVVVTICGSDFARNIRGTSRGSGKEYEKGRLGFSGSEAESGDDNKLKTISSSGVLESSGSEAESGDEHNINNYRGLSSRRPVLAIIFAIFLLAQTGIPPTSGFYAKFSVISAVVDERSYPLAVVAMLLAVAAAFVYVRLLIVMFFTNADDETAGESSGELNGESNAELNGEPNRESIAPSTPNWKQLLQPTNLTLYIAAAFTLALGIYPEPLQDLATSAAQMLV